MAHSDRFSALLAEQGLSHPEAAKLLHVSLRTLQNWLSAKHQIPYMAFKLLRLLRYMELPGKSWQGWHFSRGMLVTPEGRTISGKDSSWWSLLIRRAHSFGELHRQKYLNDVAEAQWASAPARAAGRAEAGLVSVSTKGIASDSSSSQSDVIMTPWPTLYAYQTDSTLTLEPVASASASALTPCSVSPLMPTFAHPKTPQNTENRQNRPQGSSAPLPLVSALSLTAPSGHMASRNAPRLSAGKSPDWSVKPASSELIGVQP